MDNPHMFDYSFLHSALPEGVARLMEEIRLLQSRLLGYRQAYPAVYSSLENAGQVNSLLAACQAGHMEGRAAEIFARNSPPINDVERAMAGYRDALFEIRMGHPPVEPVRQDLLRLHSLLLARGPEPAGLYREEPVEFALSPVQIPEALEVWEQMAMEVWHEKGRSALLAIPCVVADFLCIHPFADGGWRMSFLVTRLLLQRAEMFLPVSWEEQVNRYQVFYTDALRQVQQGQGYWSFVEVFLSVLYLCGSQAEKTFALLPGRKMTKKSRVEAVVAGSPVPISKGEICRLLPDVSPTTVEAALGELVRSGQAVRVGSARMARYAMAWDAQN